MLIELAEAKQSLPVIHDADDALITDHIVAAQDYIEQYIGRSVPWLDGSEPAMLAPIPSAVKQAAYLLVGDYYFKKDESDLAVRRLLNPYRVSWGV